MKKLLSLLLTAALLLSVLVVPAGANATTDSGLPYDDIGHLSENEQTMIIWLYNVGMMGGTGDRKFSPDALFTRSMFVTMTGRLEDRQDPLLSTDIDANYDGPTGFSDVPEGRWDSPYVKWAAEKGIVNGVGNGRFDPTGSITTEQFAAIVGRYLDYLGQTLSWSVNGKPSVYPDIHDLKNVSEYAKDYVIVLLGSGILPYKVDGSGVLVRPQHRLTRAEVAVMFADIFMLVVMNPDFGIEKDTPWGTVESIVQ